MTTTIEEEIQDADDAFLSAVTPKTINGKELQPFSLMREVIAQEFIGPEANLFFAAVMRVYVCTLEPADVVKLRADKAQAVIDAFGWAEAQGFRFTNWASLRELYVTLNDEIAQSVNALNKDNGSDETPNAGGPQE